MLRKKVSHCVWLGAVSSFAVGSLSVASAAPITLNDSDTQTYTPSSAAVIGSVDTRTLGATTNDTSNIDFTATADSVGTNTDLALPAQTPNNTATQLWGQFDITTGGDYIFNCTSDDGSRLFIDGNMVVNNEGPHGFDTRTNTIALDAGRHEIRVDYVNTGGGGALAVQYSGPDNSDIMGVIPTTELYRAENSAAIDAAAGLADYSVVPDTIVALGDDITLAASASATIALSGTAFANAGLGTFNVGTASTLNVTGAADRDLRFDSTTFSGASTYTFNIAPDLAPGLVSGTAASTTIVKQGAGRLILDNTSDTSANDFTGTTIDVQAGELYVIGSSATGATNPLGTAAVQLNGTTLSLDTALGDVSFDNAISLAGTGGTIRAISGPRTHTLSSTTPIDIGSGQTLTLDPQSGGASVNGSTIILNAPLSGSGDLVKNQTNIGDGTRDGYLVLTGDSSSFSGPVTLNAAFLEGRAASAASKVFGTGTVTVNSGKINLRGLDATADTSYTLGNDVSLAAGTTIDVRAGTGGGADSDFALGALSTDGAYTVTMNTGNGYDLSFTDTTIGGNTTFAVNGATLGTGNVGENVGPFNLTKTGGGTLVPGDASSYTGTTAVNGGVLVASVIADSVDSSLGNGTGTVTLNNGTLRYTGTTAATTTRQFNVNNGAGGTIEIVDALASLEIAASIRGNNASALIKQGPGTLLLSGATDNSSLILSAQNGLTQLNKSAAGGTRALAGIKDIATGATVRLTGLDGDQVYDGSTAGNYGNLGMSGGTFDLNERSEWFSRMNGSGLVTNDGGAATTSTITTGNKNGNGTFWGFIQDGTSGGKVALRKVGSGVQMIGFNPNGINTYSGGTTISGGTLRLDGTPMMPLSGSALWLDAADASSVTLASGEVAAWNDKSGNGRDATQGNTNDRPGGYGANTEANNLNTVNFTGSGTQRLDVDLTFLNNSEYTIFSVEGKQSAGNNVYYLGTRASGTNNGLHIGYRNDTQYALAQYGNDLNYTDTGLAYTGAQVFRQWTCSLNTDAGGGHAIALGGDPKVSNTDLRPLNSSGAGVVGQGFSGQQYIGSLGEIIMYDSKLSEAEKDMVESYLSSKWFGTSGSVTGSDILPTGGAVNIDASGATLDLNGVDQQLGSLSGVGGSLVTLGDATLTIGGSDTATFAGDISGSGGVTMAGSGTQGLSGANSYSGDTTVSSGTLRLDTASLADGAAVILITGGTLDLAFVGEDEVDAFFIDGGAQTPGKWGRIGSITALGADFESALISGDGLLSVSPGIAAYNSWAAGFTPNPGLPSENGDTDPLSNLLEFAFGTNPIVDDANVLSVAGTTAGTPTTAVSYGPLDYDAQFVQRKDGTVIYTVQFSNDLVTFEDSTETPVVVADIDGEYEIVEVTYPIVLSNGEKARFFRVKVELK